MCRKRHRTQARVVRFWPAARSGPSFPSIPSCSEPVLSAMSSEEPSLEEIADNSGLTSRSMFSFISGESSEGFMAEGWIMSSLFLAQRGELWSQDKRWVGEKWPGNWFAGKSSMIFYALRIV